MGKVLAPQENLLVPHYQMGFYSNLVMSLIMIKNTVRRLRWILTTSTGLEIATDKVTNVTNIFSLTTKNSGLVTTLVTRFLYDLDLN